MSDVIISLENIGRMYKLYDKPSGQLLTLLGLGRLARYREFWALRNFDLTVCRGERVGLIGRNGAGKSTLLKLICNRIEATEGRVRVNGQLQALLSIGAGFHNEFTGRENIKIALALQGLSAAEIRHREEEIIDFAEIEEFIDQPVKFYSAGMYTRLAFAVATTIDPDVLIIDEVLGAGDASFTVKCAERMRRITRESGATVLYVSHALETVVQLCDRAILIDSGRLVADNDPLSVIKLYNHRVREEEELALRSREFRLRKRDLRRIVSGSDFRPIMFSIRCSTPHPARSHIFRSAALLHRDSEVARLDFGSPMDNTDTARNRVVDAVGLMDWGRARRDKAGYFRRYEDLGGRYAHAPFVLSLPQYFTSNEVQLVLEAEIDPEGDVSVHQLVGDVFVPLGDLPPGVHRTTLDLAADDAGEAINEAGLSEASEGGEEEQGEPIGGVGPAADAAIASSLSCAVDDTAPVPQRANGTPVEIIASTAPDARHQGAPETHRGFVQSNSVYGSGELIVQSIDILNNAGESARVFEVGDSLTFRLELKAFVPVEEFVAVICIYFADTRAASQVFCPSARLGLQGFLGRTFIEVEFDPLRLGADEYIASIGLFKSCDPTTAREEPSYCVIDRAVNFKVYQPEGMAKSLGSFAHTVTWKAGRYRHVYDGASEYKILA
jgi:homopolymeric O-antigen transport system ATP-binding protein